MQSWLTHFHGLGRAFLAQISPDDNENSFRLINGNSMKETWHRLTCAKNVTC